MVTQMPAEYIAGALEIPTEKAQEILEAAQAGGVTAQPAAEETEG